MLLPIPLYLLIWALWVWAAPSDDYVQRMIVANHMQSDEGLREARAIHSRLQAELNMGHMDTCPVDEPHAIVRRSWGHNSQGNHEWLGFMLLNGVHLFNEWIFSSGPEGVRMDPNGRVAAETVVDGAQGYRQCMRMLVNLSAQWIEGIRNWQIPDQTIAASIINVRGAAGQFRRAYEERARLPRRDQGHVVIEGAVLEVADALSNMVIFMQNVIRP